MGDFITVREHARLTTRQLAESSLDEATITEFSFNWLCKHAAEKFGRAKLLHLEDRQCLKLDNYVGVIETPDGTRLEILPKHRSAGDEISGGRDLIMKMIASALELPKRDYGPAHIRTVHQPASEWLMGRFLQELDQLVKRGIRFEYRRVEEEQRFLRGQLDIARQLRQPLGRQHHLHVRHDIYTPDRAENRLIKSALNKVRRFTRQADNWRLAQELAVYLDPIPLSPDYKADFKDWRSDRLTADYKVIRPWCQLLLSDQNPLTQVGEWQGVSMLFPMEMLFERYVAKCLSRTLAPGWRLATQLRSEYLCQHLGQDWFQLQPDIKIYSAESAVILDTKWKLLDSHLASKDKYGLSQGDFYQLFAYGQRYLKGKGELFLIYPKTDQLQQPLPPFAFSDELRLWVIPFDLDAEELVAGSWDEAAPWLAQRVTRAA